MQKPGYNGASEDLESRLTGLILSNAGGGQGHQTRPPPGFDPPTGHAAPQPQLQQQQQQQQQPVISAASQIAGQPADEFGRPAGKAAKKRPNQAQRRQMNAQLSIPIDPHATPEPDPRHLSGPRPQQQQQQQQQHWRQQYQQNGPSHAGPGRMRPQFQEQPDRLNGPNSRWQQRQGQGQRNSQANWNPGFQRNDGYNGNQRGPQHSSHNPSHNPRPQSNHNNLADRQAQSQALENLCQGIVANAEIEHQEIIEKEQFRMRIEHLCREVIAKHEMQLKQQGGFPLESVALQSFGSLASGFATKASDLDLGLVSPLSSPQPDDNDSPIPRLIEKAFLDAGIGARLLTRTRVPIIKLCESPPQELMKDLLESRERWELGLDQENFGNHDGDDGVDADAGHAAESSGDHHKDSTAEVASSSVASKNGQTSQAPSTSGDPKPASDGHVHLKQLANQSLPAYYGTAKRMLRGLGGRDMTHSNIQDLTEHDLNTILQVCRAFLSGLHDEELRARLQKYRSIALIFTDFSPVWRSLLGVFTQIEGEQIVMQWERRTIMETAREKERVAEDLIAEWKSAQDYPGFGAEPLQFTKRLQFKLDKIKKLSTVQLLRLEQTQYESVPDYYKRTLEVASALKPSGEALSSTALGDLITHHYVHGIWSHEARASVEAFLADCSEKPDLASVSRRHRTIQIAQELEKALEKNLYDASVHEHVRNYIAILRGPLCQRPGLPEYYLPAPPPELLAVIQSLEDPSKLAPNQPRDRYRDKLEFPKTGAGVQCDVNFSAHLALHNTALLRCYSHTDPRVRPMVLFVKHWAKRRGINTPYRGTLSSYGYALMVIHYLVNVVKPFVCPNLQLLGPPAPPPDVDLSSPDVTRHADPNLVCRGRFVGFWRDEPAIKHLAGANQLNVNRDSVGQLLRGFFEYYAQTGNQTTYPGTRGFDWGRDVLSIRTQGGIMPKQAKGWTGAKTVVEYRPGSATANPATAASPAADQGQPAAVTAAAAAVPSPNETAALGHVRAPSGSNNAAPAPAAATTEVKEIRHRYLFAIEDPFELDHNVARTVTHNGIVSIRDEFRRGWRIIKMMHVDEAQKQGAGHGPDDLLQDVNDVQEDKAQGFAELLADIHGLRLGH